MSHARSVQGGNQLDVDVARAARALGDNADALLPGLVSLSAAHIKLVLALAGSGMKAGAMCSAFAALESGTTPGPVEPVLPTKVVYQDALRHDLVTLNRYGLTADETHDAATVKAAVDRYLASTGSPLTCVVLPTDPHNVAPLPRQAPAQDTLPTHSDDAMADLRSDNAKANAALATITVEVRPAFAGGFMVSSGGREWTTRTKKLAVMVARVLAFSGPDTESLIPFETTVPPATSPTTAGAPSPAHAPDSGQGRTRRRDSSSRGGTRGSAPPVS